jgi:hypothetical protein
MPLYFLHLAIQTKLNWALIVDTTSEARVLIAEMDRYVDALRAQSCLSSFTCHSQFRRALPTTLPLFFSYTQPYYTHLTLSHLPMPNPISSNATLHALTERLASHSRTLSPFSFATDRMAAYRQPAPPPQLPVLQLSPRHQDVPQGQPVENGAKAEDKGSLRCPVGNGYSISGEHSDKRCAKCEDEELNDFMVDMSLVEQCW